MIVKHSREKESMKPIIEKTADGSHTLFVSELDEHYHSVNGAIQESTHVFIETGFKHSKEQDIHIFEVGFGTGLNAFLTLLEAKRTNKKVYYTSIEAYPLDKNLIRELNYPQQIAADTLPYFYQLHEAEWGKEEPITENFFLKKIHADFVHFDFATLIEKQDIIYFDAFAPDKQPDMWSQEIFDKLFDVSAEKGILVTYCAKGAVRRMMQQAGYTTERLPGPPGKREMLRATKL